jgi:uridine kinase
MLIAYPDLELSDILVSLIESSFGDVVPFLNSNLSSHSLHLGQITLLDHDFAKVNLVEHGDYWISKDSVEKLARLSYRRNLHSEELFLKTICDSKHDIEKMYPSINLNQLHDLVDGYLRKNERIEHTESFLKKNTESYFIVNQKYLDKMSVISEIDQLNKITNKAFVAIDGNATSGKTTFSNFLLDIFDCNVFHMDDYLMKPQVNSLDPYSFYASNINFSRLEEEVVHPYHQQCDSMHQLLDLKNHQLSSPVKTTYKPITIIEGAYSMHPYIEKEYQLKIFMKTSYLKQIKRIYKRNGFKRLMVFVKKWIPMENTYFRDLEIAKHADIIIKT